MKRLLAIVLALTAACAEPVRSEPALWTLKDRDSEIVIFGSVHLLPEGVKWRSRRLERAIARADEIWFELPDEGAVNASAALEAAQRGTLPPGEKLSALLSAEGRQRLARLVEVYRLPPDAVERLEPWLADITLQVAAYQRDGAREHLGVERVIGARAPAKARRRAFESAAEQLDFFDGAPLEDQVASLERSMRELEQDPGSFRTLIAAWSRGDLQTIEREALAPLREAAPELYRTLIVSRNRRWADEITRMLHGRGRVVVVVGAGHLAGPDGVPALLRARGLKLDGP
jgi:hypothetical protein